MKTAAASMNMRRNPKASQAGVTLAEVSIGMALIVTVLGMIFAMNGQLLSLLSQGKKSNYATQLIAERMDQFRGASWQVLTNPTSLSLAVTPGTQTGTNLPDATEIYRIEPYENPAGRFAACVRTPNGVQSPTGVDFYNEPAVKISITVRWTAGKRTRERQFVTVMSAFRG